ncbi:Light-independent protochlorophyllide reductase subunit B [ANME-1 cluster archaeon GoMg1]|nr:Light-independent protochlorophyllide reductase subunit B [ANME-1 cluster archaeon GoMg1]
MKLWCKLLGAARALSGISDSVSIVHSRPGCHNGMFYLRTLGSNQNDIRIVGSGFQAHDAIYGGEEKLANVIRLSYENFKPSLIAVLNCSAPVLMGADIEGIVYEMKEEIPAEIIALSTGGYEGPAWMGYEETLAELTRFMVSCEDPSDSKINLIGCKQDDVKADSDLLEIKRMLNSHEISINTVLTNSSFEKITNAPKASLNVVLGGDGLECAKVMQEKFGTPYVITSYPYGLDNSINFLKRVTTGLNKEVNKEFIASEKEWIKKRIEKVYFFLHGICGMSVAVIGDSSHAFDLSRFLSDELCLDVKVLAITSRNHVSQSRADDDYFEMLLIEPDRFRMNEIVKSKGIEMIFGSSLEKKLAYELNVPLIRTFYPVFDGVSISDSPYAGFKGVINLAETIINSVINNYTEVE